MRFQNRIFFFKKNYTMKKADLTKKLKAVKAKIAELRAAEPVAYVTSTKHVPSVGYVHELESLKDCVRALSKINKQFALDDESALSLGVESAEITTIKYLGHSQKDWQNDVQKRVNELNSATLLNKLIVAEKVLNKHRSEEDIFNDDMDEISDVLESVG